MSAPDPTAAGPGDSFESRIAALLDEMTLTEKVGQMSQVHAEGANAPDELGDAIRAGRIGSVINNVDLDVVSELQRIAVEESRLGIPLLFGRDVIHGFRTIFPIPLGQAATWNPELVREGARLAAREAATRGINWTFAPMMDITRDPRWGRIAESLGEDPYLASELAVAMVEGFQGEDLSAPGAIAATAKHFAGYGESESGRDYATTNIPENELRNVHLRPFRAAVDAGVSTVMPSFSDLNGVPATANAFLNRQVLRDEWGFDGFVVSDWRSIDQLSIHGLTANDRESALAAATAGINMEMAGSTYIEHLPALVEEGRIDIATIDAAVAEILRTKFELGLFERPWADVDELPPTGAADALAASRQTALQSVVMLRNEGSVLPLDADRLSSLAVIGPLADAPYEQLGTWVFDGDPSLSVTALDGLRDLLGDRVEIRHVAAMETSRSLDTAPFNEAVAAAEQSDAVVLFLGEESILSGEAHSRADIGLPGAQAELVRRVRATGKPVVAVILAGRPLTLADIVDEVDALLFAWHPGTMGGAAIADILFGVASPSGKLPVTFPRMVGQIPIYYSQKNTGKPPTPDTVVHIDDIDPRAPQTSFGMTAFHLDAGYTPQWEFGFGLSYASFEYSDLAISNAAPAIGDVFTVSASVTNTGDVTADEIVQLYVRDLVGNVTRPVRELKGFGRVTLEPGETRRIDFELGADDLAFYGRDNTLIVEPGDFHVWIGGSSNATLRGEFRLVAAN
ncbi:MAG: glycoside hydrolase family 3 N-terminal domain-containing protein [Woeseiaceae bacterium]|jgi:beta-glucosidase|nr:glycoside hydrolase family 3 N-terminal domain-containing protein [Woeseiaceae bacterium]